jgi:N-acetylglutamate synthase-like GNAT family acetyltransferase
LEGQDLASSTLNSRAPRSEPELSVIRHGPMALLLRQQLPALQQLLDDNSFWAAGRSRKQQTRMLGGSQAVVSAWRGQRLVGFGRASSDGAFRAVLWDVVIPEDLQGQGLGRQLVEALLNAPALQAVERVYLMTTNSAGFYAQLGFEPAPSQKLLLRTKKTSG